MPKVKIKDLKKAGKKTAERVSGGVGIPTCSGLTSSGHGLEIISHFGPTLIDTGKVPGPRLSDNGPEIIGTDLKS